MVAGQILNSNWANKLCTPSGTFRLQEGGGPLPTSLRRIISTRLGFFLERASMVGYTSRTEKAICPLVMNSVCLCDLNMACFLGNDWNELKSPTVLSRFLGGEWVGGGSYVLAIVSSQDQRSDSHSFCGPWAFPRWSPRGGGLLYDLAHKAR